MTSVTGHGYVGHALRTQTGRVLLFLLHARLVPRLDFEVTSEHAMAVEGLEVSRKLDEHGVVRGHVTHTASGETAQLTAYRKLFCLSNVPVKAANFESSHLRRGAWAINETTLAAKASKPPSI